MRDARLPRLAGLFVWSDFCDGVLRAIHPGATAPTELPLKQRVPRLTSFGVDGLERVHVTTLDGRVYRLDPLNGRAGAGRRLRERDRLSRAVR